ncbi:MAG: hypothetical protein A2V45_12445 [Candidatus Aminicenantes bacterium RBG_19FT_COMBO_58_17]|nr:MAG: hypothetical protein A2V45_12445 [Candidatus Aminicenantes bacterium RBG_19FT_COMBO_58_17]
MAKEKQSNHDRLKKGLDIKTPIIGFYDAPDPALFEPWVSPEGRDCVFSFYHPWLQGKTLHITKDRYGCGGAGHWMWGIELRSRKEFLEFLVDDEGLKASHALMEKWINAAKPYRAEHPHLFLGPLKEEAWLYIKTITFLVNPDQMSALAIGAQYHSAPDDPPPVIAPFGSGCSQFQPFRNLDIAQASIGATDIAMRQHLPADLLTFTVTKLMFRQLCALDEKSFLDKPFLQRLKHARGGRL